MQLYVRGVLEALGLDMIARTDEHASYVARNRIELMLQGNKRCAAHVCGTAISLYMSHNITRLSQ
jgi:hypothetical protein